MDDIKKEEDEVQTTKRPANKQVEICLMPPCYSNFASEHKTVCLNVPGMSNGYNGFCFDTDSCFAIWVDIKDFDDNSFRLQLAHCIDQDQPTPSMRIVTLFHTTRDPDQVPAIREATRRVLYAMGDFKCHELYIDCDYSSKWLLSQMIDAYLDDKSKMGDNIKCLTLVYADYISLIDASSLFAKENCHIDELRLTDYTSGPMPLFFLNCVYNCQSMRKMVVESSNHSVSDLKSFTWYTDSSRHIEEIELHGMNDTNEIIPFPANIERHQRELRWEGVCLAIRMIRASHGDVSAKVVPWPSRRKAPNTGLGDSIVTRILTMVHGPNKVDPVTRKPLDDGRQWFIDNAFKIPVSSLFIEMALEPLQNTNKKDAKRRNGFLL